MYATRPKRRLINSPAFPGCLLGSEGKLPEPGFNFVQKGGYCEKAFHSEIAAVPQEQSWESITKSNSEVFSPDRCEIGITSEWNCLFVCLCVELRISVTEEKLPLRNGTMFLHQGMTTAVVGGSKARAMRTGTVTLGIGDNSMFRSAVIVTFIAVSSTADGTPHDTAPKITSNSSDPGAVEVPAFNPRSTDSEGYFQEAAFPKRLIKFCVRFSRENWNNLRRKTGVRAHR